jgi:hypothetical protein
MGGDGPNTNRATEDIIIPLGQSTVAAETDNAVQVMKRDP